MLAGRRRRRRPPGRDQAEAARDAQADRRGAGALHHPQLPAHRRTHAGAPGHHAPGPRARDEPGHLSRRVDRRQPLPAAAHGRHRAGRRSCVGGWRARRPADPTPGSLRHHAGADPRAARGDLSVLARQDARGYRCGPRAC